MSTTDERNIEPIGEMTRIAQDILVLPSIGYRETYRSANRPKLIYDSEWWRIRLVWDGWDYMGGNSISMQYGRLHAPSEKNTMIWQGEECHCWHRLEYALHLLDGRTTGEAAELHYSHRTTAPFYKEDIRKRFNRRQPEWLAEMGLTVWQQYGQRLFDLFDLQQPDLWQQYRQFLKEVFDSRGRSPRPGPPQDKVC